MLDRRTAIQAAVDTVRDAGGHIVGRTKLQKVAYLLEVAGFGVGFEFKYRHYGPYSEDLAEAVQLAADFGFVTEIERPSNWGGTYSVFEVTELAGAANNSDRAAFAAEAAKVDSIELELAATAVYLKTVEEAAAPWAETARRKPDKADPQRLKRAKDAYGKLLRLRTPNRLPDIA